MNAAETDTSPAADAKTFQHRPAELEDEFDNLLGSFPDQDLFSIEQGDYRVGRLLDELDQVGIDREQL